eukprot:356031-Chlamydomonas_euryale.AAC.11
MGREASLLFLSCTAVPSARQAAPTKRSVPKCHVSKCHVPKCHVHVSLTAVTADRPPPGRCRLHPIGSCGAH